MVGLTNKVRYLMDENAELKNELMTVTLRYHNLERDLLEAQQRLNKVEQRIDNTLGSIGTFDTVFSRIFDNHDKLKGIVAELVRKVYHD